jgi:hypothetical protein
MLLPEPASNADDDQRSIRDENKEHTFAVDPQERASGLPFCKDAALREPLCRPPVVKVARDVVIR